jgi:single-strand DNA-binding protein
MSINKYFATGKIVSDVVLRKTNGDIPVVNFRIVVLEGFGNKKKANYFDCCAWKETAEYIANNAPKGALISIEGHLNQRVWQVDGKNRSQVEIEIDDVVIMGVTKGEAAEMAANAV